MQSESCERIGSWKRSWFLPSVVAMCVGGCKSKQRAPTGTGESAPIVAPGEATRADQIGFGKSTKPQAYQFSFQALASNTWALLAAAKVDRVTVLGHSMGGIPAVRYALMYPAGVEQLVLVDPIGLEDWKTVGSVRGHRTQQPTQTARHT